MKRFARGRTVRRQPGAMNRLEAAYAIKLEAEKREGRIHWFEFDAIKLRLAEKTFYTPDFFVMRADGEFEIHEVKGTTRNKKTKKQMPFVEDDAAVKIKVAAEKYPIRFLMVWLESGTWVSREY